MNNRNKLIIAAVILVVIIGLIVLVVLMRPNENLLPSDATQTSSTSAVTNPSEEATDPTTQPTQGAETTAPTSPSETTVPSRETQPDETDGDETKPVETEPVETKPEETEPEETKPEETEPEETKPNEQGKNPWDVTYEEYQNMSATEQRAQMEAFGSIDEFFVWYDTAKKKHEAENPGIEIGGGGVVNPGGEN